MKYPVLISAALATLVLSACEQPSKEVVAVPVPGPAVPVPVQGPQGPQGAPGPAGEKGEPGKSNTVVIVPPAERKN